MKENLLFLPVHSEKHESVMKKKIRKFILAYNLLEEFLSMGTNPNDEVSLHFYSELYTDMAPLMTEITCYLISKGYTGKRKSVDNVVFLSQKILGFLKVLHQRYVIAITSQDMDSDPRWYGTSDKSNSQIIDEMLILFHEMNKGGVITCPFFYIKFYINKRKTG